MYYLNSFSMTKKKNLEKIITEMYASLSLLEFFINHPEKLKNPENLEMMQRHIDALLNEFLPELQIAKQKNGLNKP